MQISKGPQAFPRSEYMRRLAVVKAEMARRDVETLIVTSWPNITYLTGNMTRMFSAHCLVVSAHDEEPALVVRMMDVGGCIHQTFLDRQNIVGYPDSYIGNPDLDGFDAVIDFIEGRGLDKRGIGFEKRVFPTAAFEKFQRRLPSARLADLSKVVDWARAYKSDLEVAVMREAATIVDAAILRAREVIRPGVRESDAAAEIVATQIRGAPGGVGATAALPLLMCTGERTGTAHIMWSHDVFRAGSHVNIELSGNRHGYVAAMMRTFSLGTPADRLRRLHEAEVTGLEAGLAAVVPGRTCSDVANAFYRTIEKHGFKKTSRCGYSIGIDWAEPAVSLQSGDMTELKPNMMFHLMLGNWEEEDFGYVISETFLVTETGAEVLGAIPRELFVV